MPGYISDKYDITFDLPNPKIDSSRFIYNFFTTDERTNDSGVPEILPSSYHEFVSTPNADQILEKTVPRYVRIDFSINGHGNTEEELIFDNHDSTREIEYRPFDFNRQMDGIGNVDPIPQSVINLREQYGSSYTQNESEICSTFDIPVSFNDNLLRERLKSKSNILSTLLGETPGTRESLTSMASVLSEDNGQTVAKLNSTISNPNASFVNDVGQTIEELPYSMAAEARFKCYFSKKTIHGQMNSDLKFTNFLNLAIEKVIENYDPGMFANVPPETSAYRIREADEANLPTKLVRLPTDIFGDPDFDPAEVRVRTRLIGYRIKRTSYVSGTSKKEVRVFDIQGKMNHFIDTEVSYGRTYSYEISCVYHVKRKYSLFFVEAGQYDPREEEFFISSDYSNRSIIKCIENKPPKEPGVVFYSFDYSKNGGLMIDWRIPAEPQRDIKYFQVFRRRDIFSPFTCIALIDFDDSEIKSIPMESINKNRIYKKDSPYSFFQDYDFDRNSDFIYAIATVDAHGLTSRYSIQSRVKFNRSKNQIEVTKISRSGAPKQYPNFFIDPEMDPNVAANSLSQDAAKFSRKRRMRIFFDPDVKSTGPGEHIFRNRDTEHGSYKMHLINLDRQLSADIELNFTVQPE